MGRSQNANPSDKMLETNGGSGHMAAVIRRIEALYQGGVPGTIAIPPREVRAKKSEGRGRE